MKMLIALGVCKYPSFLIMNIDEAIWVVLLADLDSPVVEAVAVIMVPVIPLLVLIHCHPLCMINISD